jgi:hypothetical protein
MKVGSSTTSLDMFKALVLTHLQDEMGSQILPSHASDGACDLLNPNKRGIKDMFVTSPLTLKKLKSSISTNVLEVIKREETRLPFLKATSNEVST